MKKLLIIAVLTLIPFAGFSQSLFDKFEDMDNVSSIVVSPAIFKILSKVDIDIDDKEASDYLEIVKNMKSVKVFITEDKSIASSMNTAVKTYVKSAALEELMRVKDKEANIKFYIRSGKSDTHVSELLMLVTGIENVNVNNTKVETVLASLTGNIDLNKMSTLINKMNLPEELNKVNEKK